MTERWADIVAIEQLLYRYAHVLDRGTLHEVMPVFAADAVLIVDNSGNETRHEGAAAVGAWLQEYHYDEAERIRNMRHKISTPLIDVEGDSATAVSYLDADGVDNTNDRGRLTVGRYEDVLARSEAGWVIRRRKLIVTDRHQFATD